MRFRTIVSGEDNQGVVGKAVFFQGVQHFADHGIGFDDEVPVVTGFRFPVIRLVRDDRIVRRIEGEVSEEGLLLFLLRNPLDSFLGDGGQDVVWVPAFGHRSRSKRARTRKWGRFDDRLSGNGNEAISFDPAVGGEVNGSVSKIVVEALI